MRLKRRLKGRDELLKLVECQTRQIQELCRAGLHVGALDIAHLWYLLSWEAQYIINRDKLKWSVCPMLAPATSDLEATKPSTVRLRYQFSLRDATIIAPVSVYHRGSYA